LGNTYIRIFRSYVILSGSNKGAVGIISISGGTFTTGVPDGRILAQIVDGDNQTLMALFTIPKDHYGLIYGYFANVGKSGEVAFDSAVQLYGTNTFVILSRIQTYQNSYEGGGAIPFVADEKTDIEIRGLASNTSVPASAGFDIILIRKDNT
jgi:hypothetical protein